MKHTIKCMTITVAAIFMVLALGISVMAVPPHPSLLDKKGANSNASSDFLNNLDALHERGICTPSKHNSKDGKSLAAVSGPFKVLALLVRFTDKSSSVAAVEFDSLLFDSVGRTVRDYYSEISYDQLDLVTVDLPSSIGWTLAPQTHAYYVDGQNGFGTYPANSQGLVKDLVNLVDPTVDFSEYDNDNDGYVDAVVVIHTGTGAEMSGSSNDFWSHKWSYPVSTNDGVTVYDYTIQPEYWNNPGDMTIGVYAHELGHAFGLPDLYDTDSDTSSLSYGIGRWCLMSYGSWLGPGSDGSSPAHASAWCKAEMGFVTPTNITGNMAGLSISNVEQNQSVYRLWSSGAVGNEYFLIENRQKVGYDTYLPGHGLLVWHIDDAKMNNRQEWYPGQPGAEHFLVALDQADGLFEMEQYIDYGDAADPFPGTGGKTTFGPLSSPSSNAYLSGATTVAINNITEINGVIIADLIVGLAADVGDEEESLPSSFELAQNYPNPFNPSTQISFTVKTAGDVTLDVYNVLGQKVITLFSGYSSTGTTVVNWDATDEHGSTVTSGIYLYRLQFDDGSETRKMVLIR